MTIDTTYQLLSNVHSFRTIKKRKRGKNLLLKCFGILSKSYYGEKSLKGNKIPYVDFNLILDYLGTNYLNRNIKRQLKIQYLGNPQSFSILYKFCIYS